MAPRLTFVLPLKGRYLFTLRTLWHANKMRVPHRFLFADGQVDETVASYLENSRTTFPELDVEYIRYPNDVTLSTYFAKVADALARVQTPYAMLLDNDDFVGFGAVQWALDFLDSHPDYACARGRMIAFAVYSGIGNPHGGVYGRVSRVHSQYDAQDFSSSRVTDRIQQGGLDLGLYNAVFRTSALRVICREAADIDFSDLMLHETFYALRAVTLGKTKINPAAIGYYRQLGSSMTYQPLRDWARELLHSRFTVDAHAVVERISTAAARVDGADAGTIAEIVRTVIEDYFRWFLWSNYGAAVGVKRAIRKNWPGFAKLTQNLANLSAGRGRSKLYSQLAADGASDDDLCRARADLAAIEDTLSRQSFVDFAGPFLSTACADARRTWF